MKKFKEKFELYKKYWRENALKDCLYGFICLTLGFIIGCLVCSPVRTDYTASADVVDESNVTYIGGNVFLPISPAREFGLRYTTWGQNANPSTSSADKAQIQRYARAVLPSAYVDNMGNTALNDLLKSSDYHYNFATPLGMVFQTDCRAYLNSLGSSSSLDLIRPFAFDWFQRYETTNTLFGSQHVFQHNLVSAPNLEWLSYTNPVSSDLYFSRWYSFVYVVHYYVTLNGWGYEFDLPLIRCFYASYSDDFSDYDETIQDSYLLSVTLTYGNNQSCSLTCLYANGYRFIITLNRNSGGLTSYPQYHVPVVRMYTTDGTPSGTVALTETGIGSQLMLSSSEAFDRLVYRVSSTNSSVYNDGFAAGSDYAMSQLDTLLQQEYQRGYNSVSQDIQEQVENAYNDGVNTANNTVNTASASFIAGFNDGISQSNSSWILSPINAVNSVFALTLFTVGDFSFKLSYLVYIALGGLFVSFLVKFVFHG